ncbi:flagellar hook-associated protein FlgL [Motilibacter rhizosphaerae]|nr:flagellar hook-associated protein FlgL [Motilibacter rhizosphaerae]
MSRVTYAHLANTSLAGIQSNLDRYSRTQEQLSSGKTISRPSDNPSGAISSMGYRSEASQYQQYADSAADGIDWLDAADTALGDIQQSVRDARTLTVQGKSTGNSDPNARRAIADQIDQLRAGILNNANRQYLGRPIFGGTTSGSAAFDSTGTYIGDSGSVNRVAADGVSVRVDTDGVQTFGSGPTSVFGILDDISNHLKTDPTQLDADLAKLDTAVTTIGFSRSSVGARTNRLDSLQQTAKDRVDNAKRAQGDIEGVDIAQATVDLQLQQVSYQAALSTASKVLQLSLTNFLR